MTDQAHIRNFCIIAHIDHGKSTLADRLLEYTGTVSKRELMEQTLDQMELEREKGITIKAQAVRMLYNALDGKQYELNLIDTPGHVDFTYEVSRSLAACEGAILVVDATQGVQAQTVANAYAAIDAGLEIIPVINKIDLPSAMPVEVAEEIEQVLGFSAEDAILVSAKTGQGIDELIAKLCEQLPPPKGNPEAPTRACRRPRRSLLSRWRTLRSSRGRMSSAAAPNGSRCRTPVIRRATPAPAPRSPRTSTPRPRSPDQPTRASERRRRQGPPAARAGR